LALPKSGHTKHAVHISIDDAWILRAYKELMNEEIPKKLENVFLEQFKDLLLNNITTESFLKDLFNEMQEESIVFKYRGGDLWS
jgi:hypothetical protein